VEAYWALGPSPLGPDAHKDPTRALVESALRALVLRTFDGPSHRAPALERLLSAEVLARQPYRAVLLRVHAPETPDSAPRAPLPPLDALAAVIELRGCAAQDEVIRLLSEPVRRSGAAAGTETLPQGELHRLRPAAQPELTEVSWLSTGPDLLVGFGRGAIGSFLAARDGDDDPAAAAYRAAIDGSRRAGDRFFEAFVNLDSLRADVPDEMGWGRCARLMNAWGVANARGLMVSGRLANAAAASPQDGPRLLVLDLALDDRSEPFGAIRTESISGTAPPAGLPMDPSAGYAIVLHPAWGDLLRRSVLTAEALAVTPTEAQARRAWLRAHDGALQRLESKLGPDVLVQSGEGDMLNLRVSIRSVAGLTDDLRAALDSRAPTVAFDRATQLWRLRLVPPMPDQNRVVQSFTFGLTASGIVGAWNPAAVLEATGTGRREPTPQP
jgi:hypothetical protein